MSTKSGSGNSHTKCNGDLAPGVKWKCPRTRQRSSSAYSSTSTRRPRTASNRCRSSKPSSTMCRTAWSPRRYWRDSTSLRILSVGSRSWLTGTPCCLGSAHWSCQVAVSSRIGKKGSSIVARRCDAFAEHLVHGPRHFAGEKALAVLEERAGVTCGQDSRTCRKRQTRERSPRHELAACCRLRRARAKRLSADSTTACVPPGSKYVSPHCVQTSARMLPLRWSCGLTPAAAGVRGRRGLLVGAELAEHHFRRRSLGDACAGAAVGV
jgi:hypothetical protein